MFAIVEDGYVVLRQRGVFRPAKVYVRNRYLYANHGSGFIRLCHHENGTSVPDISHEELTLPFTPARDNIGRLMKP